MTCALALCTWSRDAQVGQEGRGKTDPRQGYNGGPRGAVLVVAHPQPLLTVREELLHGPADFVPPDQLSRRPRWGVGHEPADLAGRVVAREDERPWTKRAKLAPAGVDGAVAGLALRFHGDEGVGAAPPKPVRAVATGSALPACLTHAAMPCQGSGTTTTLLSTSLHDRMAAIVGSKQDHNVAGAESLQRPDEWGGQLGPLPARESQRLGLLRLHIQPDAPGADVATAHQEGAAILVPPQVGVSHGVLQLSHRVQAVPPCCLLGIINAHIDGLPRRRVQGPEPRLGLLAEGGLGVPARDHEAIIHAGPVGRGLQIAVAVGNIPPAPRTGDGPDQSAHVRPMIPVKVPMQGLKTRVKRGGNAEDAAPGVILRGALAGGRWVHSCTIPGGWPLLPPMSSLLHDFPPKTQST
jgi:hypothetical protein